MLLPSDAKAATPTLHAPAPNVLQLLPDLSPNPVSRRVLSLVRGISGAGGQSIVASAGGHMSQQMTRAGSELVEFATARSGIFRARGHETLLNKLHTGKIELIHVHHADMVPVARTLADAASVPLVVSCHGLPQHHGFFALRAARRLLSGRPLIAMSHYAGDVLVKELAIPSDDITIIRQSIEASEFAEDLVSTERTISLMERWGIVEDARPVILVPDTLLDDGWISRLAGLIADWPARDALWVLVAPAGSLMPLVFETSKFAARIRWVAGCSDIAAAYKLASIALCLPMDADGLTDSVLEVQAAGRPVVLTDVGAAAEMLETGDAGWLVPEGDKNALATALSGALALDELDRTRMGKAGQSFVRRRFAPDRMLRETITLYEQTIDAHR